MVRLGNYIKITNGFAFKSSIYAENGGRVIRITNVQKGLIEDDNPKFYPENQLSKLEKYKIFKNDILMSLTGNVGRVGRFPKELLPAYINQRVCRVKSKSKDLSDDYLFHILNSNDFENRAMNNSTGIAQMNLSTKWIEEFQIPLPPLETQKRIAQILDHAQALKSKTELLLKEYDALAQSIFLDMFGDPVTNPKGLVMMKLSKLGNFKNGLNFGSGDSGYKIKCLGVGDFKSRIRIDSSQLSFIDIKDKPLKDYFLKIGDIVFVRSNGNRALVGRCLTVFTNDENVTFSGFCIRLRPNENVSSLYLTNMFQINSFKMKMLGGGRGANIQNINQQILGNLDVPVPSLELQNQFAEKITLIEQQKELAKQELKESEDLFNCLMQKAFKGEII